MFNLYKTKNREEEENQGPLAEIKLMTQLYITDAIMYIVRK